MSPFLSSPLLAVAVTLGGAGSYQFLTNSPAYPIRGDVSTSGYMRGESVAFLAEAARERIFLADYINYNGGTKWSYDHPPHTKNYYKGAFPLGVPLSRSSAYAPDDIDDPRGLGVSVMATNISAEVDVLGKDFAWSGLRSSDSFLILTNFSGGAETTNAPSYSVNPGGQYFGMFSSGRPVFSRSFDYAAFIATGGVAARWLPIRGGEIAQLVNDFDNNNALAFNHVYFDKTHTMAHQTAEEWSFSPGSFYNTYVPPDPEDPDKPYGYIGPPEWQRTLVSSNIVHTSGQGTWTNSTALLTWHDAYRVARRANWGWTGSNLVSTVESFDYTSTEQYSYPASGGAPVVTFDYLLKDHVDEIAVYGIFNARETETIYNIVTNNPKQSSVSYKVNRDAWLLKKLTANKVDASVENGVMFELLIAWPSLAMSVLSALGDNPPSTEDSQIKSLVVAPSTAPAAPYAYMGPSNSLSEVSAEVSLRRNYEVRFVNVVGVAKIVYAARKAD